MQVEMTDKTNLQAPLGTQEDEVYGTLGALLGMLEVVATDDGHPLAGVQIERLRGALAMGAQLETQIDALLILALSDLGQRLRRSVCRLRALVEHALRGALRATELADVQLVWPRRDDWGEERVSIDVSRVDRMLRALAEGLARSVGRGGSIAVAVERADEHVVLGLVGRASGLEARALTLPSLIDQAARRLFELHGGGLRLDGGRSAIEVVLPVMETA